MSKCTEVRVMCIFGECYDVHTGSDLKTNLKSRINQIIRGPSRATFENVSFVGSGESVRNFNYKVVIDLDFLKITLAASMHRIDTIAEMDVETPDRKQLQ